MRRVYGLTILSLFTLFLIAGCSTVTPGPALESAVPTISTPPAKAPRGPAYPNKYLRWASEEECNALNEAAKDNDVATLTALVEKNINPDCFTRFIEETPLKIAVFYGNMEAVVFLVESGALVSTEHLMSAISRKHMDIADYLISVGAKPELPDVNWKKTFRWLSGDLERFKYMVENGASPYGYDGRKTSAQAALERGDTEILDYLHEFGLTAKPDYKMLVKALLRSNLELADSLIQRGVDPEDVLLPLASTGDLTPERLDYLLGKGATLRPRYQSGLTTLHVSMARECQPAQVELLLGRGLPPGVLDNERNAPMHFMQPDSCHKEIVKKLLLAGGEFDLGNAKGNTPLMIAVMKRNVEVVRLLLERGADPNKVDLKGEGTLSRNFRKGAPKEGSKEAQVARLLLEAGASPYMRYKKSGKTLADLISERDWAMLGVYDLEPGRIEQPTVAQIPCEFDYNTFNKLKRKNNFPAISNLLDNFTSECAPHLVANKLITIASEKGSIELLNMINGHLQIEPATEPSLTKILSRGAEIAITNKNYEFFAYLLDLGLEPEPADGTELLILLLANGEYGLFEKVLESGIQPTHFALFTSNFNSGISNRKPHRISLEALQFLDRKGILDKAITHGGAYFTLFQAAEQKNTQAVQYLVDKGADVTAAFTHAAKNGFPEAATLLLAYGPNIDARDKAGNTPLLNLLRNSDFFTARLLLEKGANPFALTRVGDTTLHLSKSPEITTLLLEMGVPIEARNDKNNTPLLSLAQEHGKRERIGDEQVKTIKALLDNGADVNARNYRNQTALSRVFKNGRADLIEMLIDAGGDS